MTGVISVVTAVHPPTLPYLTDAYQSLLIQDLPDGWDWQWLVQQDGRSDAVAAVLPDDSRISYRAGPARGPSTARTVALARAEGCLVRNLDADDQLTAGALARDIAVFDGDDRVGWTTSRLCIVSDGIPFRWSKDHSPPPGRLARGWVFDFWRAHRVLPVYPTTLCIRRDLLLALGGWMALTTGGDLGLLMAASVASDGYFIGASGVLYRLHPDQTVGQDFFHAADEKTMRRQLTISRAEALRALLDRS